MKMMKGEPPQSFPKSSGTLDAARAETLALQALAFLAQDAQRIQKFLQLTGVEPGDLPALAPQRGFLLAVLDHFASDDELLVSFAKEIALNPEMIARARIALGGDA